MTMTLKELHLFRQDYGDHKGSITGTAKFEGQAGGISIALLPHQTKGVVAAVAEALVATAREASQMLESEVIETTAQIEHKKSDA